MEINGLILESKYPEYQFLIKGPMQKMWRDGFPVDEQKILILQFDRYICFVDEMAQEQEWTDDDRMHVSRQLEVSLDSPKFRDMWIHQPVRPPKPWPTYDETHHKQIPTIASSIGMVSEALAYEQSGREGGPRPEVLRLLTELQEASQSLPEDADEMAAV